MLAGQRPASLVPFIFPAHHERLHAALRCALYCRKDAEFSVARKEWDICREILSLVNTVAALLFVAFESHKQRRFFETGSLLPPLAAHCPFPLAFQFPRRISLHSKLAPKRNTTHQGGVPFWCRWWDSNPHGVATNGF